MESAVCIAQLLDHIKESVPLTEEDIALIVPHLDVITINNKGQLFAAGDVSHHMRYIASGCLRSYYLTENAEEHTLQLGIENWWINDLYSYLTQKPSRMYIQALETSCVVQIPRDALEQLYQEVPAINSFFRIKIQNAYVALQERILDSMSMDTFEKYVRFRNQYRNIEQRVPQYIIASYLGTSPENLSYLRKKHSSRLS